MFFYSGLLKAVKNFKPDVIITTGFSMATVKIWWYCKRRAIPYVIWSGSIPAKGRLDSFPRIALRRFLAHHAAAFVAYGTKAKEYLIRLGVAEEKIAIAVNTVDVSFFSAAVKNLRCEFALNGRKHLTYIGELSARKNVQQLLQVIQALSSMRRDFVLDVIGDGGERKSLERFVRDKNLCEFVHFHGYQQKLQLPEHLARSSCFLFQTDFDIWGLVLVEAMAAGIPCLASVHAGASFDLIKDGENGFLMDFKNADAVVEKVNCLLDNHDQVASFGKNAQRFVFENANLKVSASGFLRALRICKAR
jgi:glycosyltransferase involved in cell wall biosynthesis